MIAPRHLLALVLLVVVGGCRYEAPFLIVDVAKGPDVPMVRWLEVHIGGAPAMTQLGAQLLDAGKLDAASQSFSVKLPAAFRGQLRLELFALDVELAAVGAGAGAATIDRLEPVRAAPVLLAHAPLPCPHLDGMFCEDFEVDSLGAGGPWVVNVVAAQSQATRQSTHVHGGQSALQAHAQPTTAGTAVPAELVERVTFPPAIGTRFVRLWIDTPALHAEPVALVSAADDVGDLQSLVVQSGALFVRDRGKLLPTGLMLPVNRWSCIEWGYHLGAAGGTSNSTVWIDDVAAPAQLISDVFATQLAVGYTPLAAAVTSYDAYIDDVAVDVARIGCQR